MEWESAWAEMGCRQNKGCYLWRRPWRWSRWCSWAGPVYVLVCSASSTRHPASMGAPLYVSARACTHVVCRQHRACTVQVVGRRGYARVAQPGLFPYHGLCPGGARAGYAVPADVIGLLACV